MTVYRLSKGIFRNDLSGRGAEKTGGRWNSKGIALLYTSSSRALCTVEVAVHMPLGILPLDYYITAIELPENSLIQEINVAQLPANWASLPPNHFTQQIGDKFVTAGKYLILKVPSAAVTGDHNYLINPFHPDFNRVRTLQSEPFTFDSRLFKR